MTTTIKKTAGQTAKVIATLFVACGLIFSSCKKGDTGPQGPAGPTGATGATGPSAKYYDFTITLNSTTNSGSYVLPSSLGTGDVVLLYVIDSYNFKYIMPYKGQIANNVSSTDSFDLTYSVGSITIFVTNNTTLNFINPITFRAVVITASQRQANPNINHNNYNEVKTAYNLKD